MVRNAHRPAKDRGLRLRVHGSDVTDLFFGNAALGFDLRPAQPLQPVNVSICIAAMSLHVRAISRAQLHHDFRHTTEQR